MYCLFCDVPCIVCVYMCTEQLPPGGYPIAVKYIISYMYIKLWLDTDIETAWKEGNTSGTRVEWVIYLLGSSIRLLHLMFLFRYVHLFLLLLLCFFLLHSFLTLFLSLSSAFFCFPFVCLILYLYFNLLFCLRLNYVFFSSPSVFYAMFFEY